MVAQSPEARAYDKTHDYLRDVRMKHSGKLEWFSRLVVLRSTQIGRIENNTAQQIFIPRKFSASEIVRICTWYTMYAPREVIRVELL